MSILHQSARFSSTPPQVLLLSAPPKRLTLPAPKIAGYLPAPKSLATPAETHATPIKRVVEAEIANSLHLIDRHEDFDAWWAEFERIAGRVKTIEEMNAELEAKRPGIIEYLKRGVA